MPKSNPIYSAEFVLSAKFLKNLVTLQGKITHWSLLALKELIYNDFFFALFILVRLNPSYNVTIVTL